MELKISFIIRHFLYFWHSTSHNDLTSTPFGVFRGGALVTSLLKFKIQRSLLTLRELSQSMGKIEFSNTAKNRTNPVPYAA